MTIPPFTEPVDAGFIVSGPAPSDVDAVRTWRVRSGRTPLADDRSCSRLAARPLRGTSLTIAGANSPVVIRALRASNPMAMTLQNGLSQR